MIKYNDNTINKWYHDGELIKVYYHDAVCYYKLTPSGQTPCFAVVADISQYSDTEFIDVFNQADDKWYKLNNLNQYEEYGIYGSGRNITTYEGKLTIDGDYEYIYSGSSWQNVGETSGSSRVPAGYIEAEYVENSTLAYINTGFKPNQDTRIVAEMQVVTSTSYNPHFGCGSWDTYNDIRMGYETGIGGTLHVKYGTNNGWTVYSNVTGDYSAHTYDWNKNEFYRDGTFIGSVTYGNFQSTYSLGIFYVIQNGSPSSTYICYGRAYSFKIYDDGTLVRDLVPCIRKSDNIVGMYDVVNNTFYYPPNYSSSNYLIAGETVIPLYPLYYDEKADPPDNLSFSSMTEAEAYECPWVGMQATIDGVKYIFSGDSQSGYEWVVKPSRLPQGYTEVEYIRNSNYNAYINTGVIPYDNTSNRFTVTAKVKSEYHSNLACATIIACEEVNSPYYGFGYRYRCSAQQDVIEFFGADNTVSKTSAATSDSAVTVTFTKTADSSKTMDVPLYIFGACGNASYTSATRYSDSTLYSMSVVKNNETVREFVPAKRDSDSVYGLYDLITNTFYTSPNGNNFSGGQPV